MGLVAPPQSAGALARVRGILLAVGIVVLLMAVGLGIVELIALPLGGVGLGPGLFYGALLVVLVLGVLALVGRRRQKKARAQAAAAR
jgi:hypothetical protein